MPSLSVLSVCLPSQNGAEPPNLSAHLYCGQTAGCIEMPLGTEVSLGLRDTVFDVDLATPRKMTHTPHPIYGPCLLWPNGWMDEDAAWYGSRPRPRPHCTRRSPRGTAAPLFSAHVYCGHGRPSQLLVSSCSNGCPQIKDVQSFNKTFKLVP